MPTNLLPEGPQGYPLQVTPRTDPEEVIVTNETAVESHDEET